MHRGGLQHERIAACYLLDETVENQSCVVVSQSWNEIHKVNDEERMALQREGLIGETKQRWRDCSRWTPQNARSRDPRFY